MGKKKERFILKPLLVTVVLLLVLVATLLGIAYHKARNEVDPEEGGLSAVERDILTVTDTYPTLFIVYGDEIDFAPSISVKYIDEINSESLAISNDYCYGMIIVNDLNGQVDLSDNEWNEIYHLVNTNDQYNFFYLGDEEFAQMDELGFFPEASALTEGDLSIGFVHESDLLVTVFGTYVVDAGYSLPEALIHEQCYAIKQSN